MSFGLQNFLSSPTVEPVPLQQNLHPTQEMVNEDLHGVRVLKVCEECGKTFNKTPAYLEHVKSHKLLQHCQKCDFKTKDKERFKLHIISHQNDKLKLRCNICHELFVSPISHRIHKRKIHKLYECRQCSTDFTSEDVWREHIFKEHSKKGGNINTDHGKNETNKLVGPQDQKFNSPDKMQLICRLCNKGARNKYQLKIHIAQHLGVSSDKISDDNLITDIKPLLCEGNVSSSTHNVQEEGGQTMTPKDSIDSVLQNLLSNDSITISTPQTNKLVVPAPIHSGPHLSDVQAKEGDSVSTTSESSILIQKTNSLSSTCLQDVIIEEDPRETDITVRDTSKFPSKLAPYHKKKGTSQRRLRTLIPCNHCSSAFTTNTALRNHKKLKHMKRPECPECNITKTSSRKVFQHQIKAHRDKLRCNFYCLALFDTREEQSVHHLNVHNRDDSKNVCRYCRMEYPRGTYGKHQEECKEVPEDRKVISCKFCDRKFYSTNTFLTHNKDCGSWQTEEKESNPPTDQVKPLPSKTELGAETNAGTPIKVSDERDKQSLSEVTDQHENVSTSTSLQEKILENPDNQENLINSQNKNLDAGNHLEKSVSESGGILHKCKFCSNTFDNSEVGVDHVLGQHKTLLSIMTKEPQVCHICSKTFVSSLSYCKHILKHYGELGLWDAIVPADLDMENIRMNCWICKTAGMKYHRYHVTTRDKTIEKLLSSQASVELASKEGEVFHCSVCEESFPCRYAFWNHIKVHLSKSSFKNAEGGKRFKCAKCPMKFKKKSELLGHLGTHLLQSDVKENRLQLKTGNSNNDCKLGEGNNRTAHGKDSEEQDKHVNENILAEKVSDSTSYPHKCKRCQKRFEKKEDGLNHIVMAHKVVLKQMMSETHACHICDKTFMKPMVLCTHILKHYSDLNMWDDLVPKNLLEQTQDRRYCWICKNMLGRKASRHINKRNNHIEKALSSKLEDLETEETFHCSLCDYSCSNRYVFWKHIMLHMYKFPKRGRQVGLQASTESPSNSKYFKKGIHECSECLHKFEEKSMLNKHMATHFLLPFVQVDGKWKTESSELMEDLKLMSESHDNGSLKSVTHTIAVENTQKGKIESQFTNVSRKFEVANEEPGAKSELLKCIRCSKRFRNVEGGIKHVLSSHKFMLTRIVREPLTCTVCGTVFKSPWCLCKHISNHYSVLGMWDALVPRDLLNMINLRNQCWICNCKLDKKYADHTRKRNSHIEKLLTAKYNKNEDIFYCSLCNNSSYPDRLEFWKHIRIHLCVPPVHCRSLNELFNTTYSNNDDKDKLLECSDCSLSFTDERGLYDHLASHFLEHFSEQDNGSNVKEGKMPETDSSENEGWMTLPRSLRKRRASMNTRDTDFKVKVECCLEEEDDYAIQVYQGDIDNELENEKRGNKMREEEDADDEFEDTGDEVEIATDDEIEIGTDDEFEIGTEDEIESCTDEEIDVCY
ncbi:zinc finger protein Xfin-like [Homarus americanus]|uniref:zinc finger protein Xfin-like n=1 Tax=Homarus americanus TaxID=6706 RepID=UPI001C459FE0|nr:zinc finger protein Xfin-like [Homarus americanus]